MNKLYIYVGCALCSLLAVSCGSREQAPVEVMTFNIRLDAASDSLNAWTHRKENAAAMIRYYEPDIIGMQEVVHNQLTDLKERLVQYTALGVGRADGKEKGEYCSLFFKTGRFDLLEQGNFALSETPAEIGVKGWDAACERIATWAILKDRATGRKFACINTHLDHLGEVARREGAKLLLAKAQELAPGLPVILTGDFNGAPGSEPVRILTEGGMTDSRAVSPVVYGPSWSFHDFGRLQGDERVLLDYVFVSGPVRVNKYRVIGDKPDTGYLSDHNPVLVSVTIE